MIIVCLFPFLFLFLNHQIPNCSKNLPLIHSFCTFAHFESVANKLITDVDLVKYLPRTSAVTNSPNQKFITLVH